MPRMRQLFPTAEEEIDPVQAYASDPREAPADRPWLVLNMISSLDGGTAIDGVSGGLGGPADREVFGAIRAMADVILVAAGTVRAERYGPPRLPEQRQRERVARGQSAQPRLAIVTSKIDLDLGTDLFTASAIRPLILSTAQAPPDRLTEAADVADVLTMGEHRVDLGAALRVLRRDHGAAVVLCEGGPSLNGALVATSAVDELCLSLSNVLIGGDSARVAHGVTNGTGASAVPTSMRLTRILEHDSALFARYVRDVRDVRPEVAPPNQTDQ